METLSYDRLWYESYERGSELDESKKYLEYAAALDLNKGFSSLWEESGHRYCNRALSCNVSPARVRRLWD